MKLNIGHNIRTLRRAADMTQDELARSAGYKSRSSINKIEVDGRGLPQKKIVDIARALKVTPSYLMGWEDEEVATLTAFQEETMQKFLLLSYEHQIVVSNIIDTLTKQEKG